MQYFVKVLKFLSWASRSKFVVANLLYPISPTFFSSFLAKVLLSTFSDVAVKDLNNGRGKNRRTLNILMSFMYVNCDIGRK